MSSYYKKETYSNHKNLWHIPDYEAPGNKECTPEERMKARERLTIWIQYLDPWVLFTIMHSQAVTPQEGEPRFVLMINWIWESVDPKKPGKCWEWDKDSKVKWNPIYEPLNFKNSFPICSQNHRWPVVKRTRGSSSRQSKEPQSQDSQKVTSATLSDTNQWKFKLATRSPYSFSKNFL